MQNQYIIVRSNSTSGPFIVELNECAPNRNTWTKAQIAGYAATEEEAQLAADTANDEDDSGEEC